jgi:hypothetical protein
VEAGTAEYDNISVTKVGAGSRASDASVMTLVSGWMRLTASAGHTIPQADHTVTGLTSGSPYDITIKYRNSAVASRVQVLTGSTVLFDQSPTGSNGTVTGQLTPSATSVAVRLWHNSDTGYSEFDDFALAPGTSSGGGDGTNILSEDFASLSAWTFYTFPVSAGYAQTTDASVGTLVSGRLRLTSSSGKEYATAARPITGLTAGQTYPWSVNYFSAAFGRVRIGTSPAGKPTGALVDQGVNGTGTASGTFIAGSSALYFALLCDTEDTLPSTADYDDVVIGAATGSGGGGGGSTVWDAWSGYSFHGGGTLSPDSSVLSVVSGQLVITASAGHDYPQAWLIVNGLTAGYQYPITVKYFNGNNGSAMHVHNWSGSTAGSPVLSAPSSGYWSGDGTFTGNFTPSGTSVRVRLFADVPSGSAKYDAFSIGAGVAPSGGSSGGGSQTPAASSAGANVQPSRRKVQRIKPRGRLLKWG